MLVFILPHFTSILVVGIFKVYKHSLPSLKTDQEKIPAVSHLCPRLYMYTYVSTDRRTHTCGTRKGCCFTCVANLLEPPFFIFVCLCVSRIFESCLISLKVLMNIRVQKRAGTAEEFWSVFQNFLTF